MKLHLETVVAIIRKDLRCLWPYVLLLAALFGVETVLTNLEIVTDIPWLNSLIVALPQLNILGIGILAIAVFHQDPANTLVHDWLTRPLSRTDLFIAKIGFLILTVTVPVVLVRFIFNILAGFPLDAAMIEASIPRNSWTVLAAIFFIGAAMLSRSIVQSLGVFAVVFVLLSISGLTMEAFPANPDALGDDLATQSVIWLLALPMVILFLGLLAAIYWLQYKRRSFLIAWAAFAVGGTLTTLIVLLPFNVSSWPVLFSIVQLTQPESSVSENERIAFDSLYSCFPSSVLSMDVDDFGTIAQQRLTGGTHWREDDFMAAGNGGVAFMTSVTSRSLPRGWRIDTLKVNANYSSSGMERDLRLRPARVTVENPDAAYGDTISNYWLASNSTVNQLKGLSGLELDLEFSLAALSPESVVLETDGVRRHFPSIGYCRAEREDLLNRVNVECFKRGLQPTMLSAELIDIPSSRVDGAYPNYAPRWLNWVNGTRYTMTVDAPSLSGHDAVLISAWQTRGFMARTLTMPGMLGSDSESCKIPGLDDPAATWESRWRDPSPHEVTTINVEDGVALEVLDWGGSGRNLLLIPGLGASAHSYDELAPRLARDYRVIGMNRRGVGSANPPTFGYGIDRLSADVLAVMDAFDMQRPVLIGHSLGGDELSFIGARHPDRVAGLVYLDAAYDRADGVSDEEVELNRSLPAMPRPEPHELRSYEAFLGYLARIGSDSSTPIPEGAVMSMLDLESGSRRIDPRIAEAIIAGLISPEYEKIKVPALAIYAVLGSPDSMMEDWYDHGDPGMWETVKKLFRLRSEFQRSQITKFDTELPDSTVIELVDADHSIFYSNQDDVLQATRQFVDSLDQP